jgi:Ca2+-binding RTX toxin-like protein
MAITASFNAAAGLLSIFSDNLDNTVTVSRNAAGNILINGGAVPVLGGNPTVANTALIQAFGLGGNDNLLLDESSGALPAVNLFGGAGNDTASGGFSDDQVFGQSGNDVLLGRGGFDLLFGGADNDTLTGGDADDQLFGEGGDDRMIWNPGDDTDLFEGGTGIDTVEVNGGGGAEVFAITANGQRVRFDRLDPAPFAIDIGTSEKLVLNANGGDDRISTTGNLAALIQLTIDGGAGNDTILGGNGKDVLLGGDGNDFIDGNQADDVALLGAGDDVFQWDPGDGSDVVEGQDGTDTLLFNGSGGDENFDVTANGGRALFFRNLGNITMDLNDVETIRLNALGGKDTTTVNNLAGTDVELVAIDLAGVIDGTTGDGKLDTVIVNGSDGKNTIDVALVGQTVTVSGLAAKVTIDHADATDSLVINGLAGNDTINAAALSAAAIKLTADGGDGNDRILGDQGGDLLLGGDGNDFIDGNQGNDIAFLGAGNDVFQWDPGDGSDVVEGQAGTDTMLFNGSNTSENFDILANGGRALFLRNVGNITMDLDDVETIRLNALGGSDNTVIGDLTGTDVTKVAIDLAAAIGGKIGDGALDSVTVNATNTGDTVTIALVGKQIVVDGLSAQVTIAHADATDRLVVNGLGGDDLINAGGLKAGRIGLQIFGGLGEDTVIGSAGNDTVNGGDGDDVALLGAGDDVFVWNPGDDNDVVEGQAGTDAMVFNGANISENIDIAANGGRVLFFRDIANVTMDLNDVETIHFNALGGADKINVGDLTGTDAKLVAIDLAGVIGGAIGDSQPDTVTVNGTNGEDVVSVSALGSKVVVDGLSAKVTADHADVDDKLVINAFVGDDIIDASTLAAGKMTLQLLGGAGDDVILGSNGGDLIDGGAGDDVVFGNAGSDTFRYSDPLDGHDLIVDFDGDAAGGQDVLNLDALFDKLGVAEADRAGRVSLTDSGSAVDVAIDADGNAANGFELKAVTLITTDAVALGQDVILSN